MPQEKDQFCLPTQKNADYICKNNCSLHMQLKQLWQSLALNFTAGSPNFAPIPTVMVTAFETEDSCHSYKTEKTLMPILYTNME